MAYDPFSDLGPPQTGADPFADLPPLPAGPDTGVYGDALDATGVAPLKDPLAAIAGAGASFVDLSKGVVQGLAGGLGAVAAAPSAILGGQPELIPQTFKEISGAAPMEPVWDTLLPPGANLYRQQINAPIAEMGTLPQAGETFGDLVLEKTGSPELATLAATALQAAPLIAGGKLGTELVKGGKAVGKAIVEDIPTETLYKTAKKTTYTRADLQKILTQDPEADPALAQRFAEDPAFRESVAKKIRKGDISIEELHPNWLGKILGAEPITTTETVETPPPEAPKGALPAAGETGTTPAPPSPDLMPGGQGGAVEPLPGTILEQKAVPDAANAVAVKDMWVRQGFDAGIGADPSGLGFVVTRRVKGMEAAPDPFADLAPVSAPEGPPPSPGVETPAPQTVETPSTATSPGPAAGPEIFVERRKVQTSGPRERRVDLETRKMIDQMTPEERSNALRFDEKTGLKSHRAFVEEEGTKPIKVALDMNGLKWINDNLGHAVGDDALRAVADAIAQAEVGDGYRLSGDEMAILADHPAAAKGAIEKIRDILKQVEIVATRPDGTETRFKGLTITRGIGGTIDEAFTTLNADKETAVKRGDRSEERGGRPPGLLEVATPRNEVPVQTPGEIPRAEGDQKGEVADDTKNVPGVPSNLRKGEAPVKTESVEGVSTAPSLGSRNVQTHEGTAPVEGKTAEAGPRGGKTPEAVVPPAVSKSIAHPPTDGLPDYAKQAVYSSSAKRRINEGGSIDSPDPYSGGRWVKKDVPIGEIISNPRNKRELTAEEKAPFVPPAEVAQEAAIAAKKEGIPLKEQKKYLVSELEDLQKNAPMGADVPEEITVLRSAWEKARKVAEDAGEAFLKVQTDDTRAALSEAETTAKRAWDEYGVAGGTVTIDVPGDGTFTVHNTKEALASFAKRVIYEFPVKIMEGIRTANHSKEQKEAKVKAIPDMVESAKDLGWHSNGHFLVKGEPKIPPKSFSEREPLSQKSVDQVLSMAKKAKPEPVEKVEFVQTGEIDKVGGKHEAISDKPVPEIDGKNYSYVRLTGKSGNEVYIDQNYYLYMMRHHPDAKAYVASEESPTMFKSGGEIVGLIMPVRTFGEAKGIRYPELTEAKEKRISESPEEIVSPEMETKIEDFGEKIGGARKDTAKRGGISIAKTRDTDTEEPWRKKYVVMEKIDGSGWTIGKKGDSHGISARSSQKFNTQKEAEKAIPLFAVAENHRVSENPDKTFSIFKRVGDRKRFKVVNQDFSSREEAMKYMAAHAEEILNIKTTFGEEILPVPEIATRKGVERRTGPATSKMFMETFAPRGIEFGNWNNQEERQMVMNHAYDGLLDLAEVLNLPPKALMLNGDLAIAFGARGQGLTGAKAHYERTYGVINLTKMKGAGSLAHEWFHALDHYLARLDTKASSEKVKNERGDLVYNAKTPKYDMQTHGPSYQSKMRMELKDAFENLVKSMFNKGEQYVEDTKQAEKFVGTARENLRGYLNQVRTELAADRTNYWKGKGGYRKSIKGLESASAEQLAEFDRLADILVEGGDLETSFRHNNPAGEAVDGKPVKGISKSELGKLMAGRYSNDTLDSINTIIKAVRNRSGFTKENSGDLDRVRAAMTTYSQRLKMFEDAKSGAENTKKVPTSFAIEARKMDQARSGDYWSEPHEMAARAFSSYVEDKIAAAGGQSDFLVYQAHGGILLPMIDGFVARPYPEGKEREAISVLFDQFVSSIKVRKTDQGTFTLYASPLDPELIAQAWRSLKRSTEELQERHRLAKNARGLDLNWFNKKVNTPYYIFTEKFPRFRGVFDRMRQMMQERDDIAASLAEDAVSFFSGLEFKEKDAVNKLLIKGRHQRKVYTREELEEEGKLSAKQIDAYLGIRAMLDRALDIYEDGIMYRITKGKMQASSNLSIPILKDSLSGLNFPDDRIEQIVALIQSMRETKRKGYAPFARFGSFSYGYVHVKEDGTPDWQNPSNYFAKEETAWKAAEKYQALLKRFHKGIEEGRLIPVPPKELKQSEEAKLLQEIGGFELDAIKKIMDLDPEIAASLKETVEQFFQAQGFRKHFFESKDSPGFSTDMERALADYIVSLSGFVARIKGIPEMDNFAKGMERHPDLARYYREWKNYSISPQEEFHQLRAGLFLYFLGGNVKSAAINLTQTFVTTIPWLTQYVSVFRATEEVTRAVKDLTAAMGKREDGSFGVVVDKLPKDIREIVRKGYDEGIVSEQLIYDLMGMAHKPSSLRKLSKQKQRIARGFGYLFSLAEKSNRLISLIAAARIHQSLSQKHKARMEAFEAGGGAGEPPKPPGGGAMPFEEDPFEFGKRATDETQFIYAKYNRPSMFRGFGALLGTFRTFVINFLEYLARLMGRKSARAIASVFFMLWAFSGVLGMPFTENVKYILENVVESFYHKKPDLETAVREWGYENMGGPDFMDYLLRGPFRQATGVDIGASVGVGDVLPFFDQDFERSPLAAIVGAPAEVLLNRPARAYGLLKEGQTYRAAETVAPEFLRNPMYAARVLREGVLDRAGGKIASKEDVSKADLAKKALGFMPTSIAKAYEREEAKRRISERTTQIKKDVTRKMVNFIREGKAGSAAEILRTEVHGVRPKVNRDAIQFTGKPLPKDPADWIVLDEGTIEKQLGEARLPAEWRGILRQPVLQRPAWLKMNKLYGGQK